MQVFRSSDAVPTSLGPSVIAIGNFDGVHRGHLSILRDLCARARSCNAAAVAITFDPHPLRVLRPEYAPKLITPLEQRLALLSATGLDATLVLPFTRAFSEYSAEAFATEILARTLGAVEVHEGDNFRFGYQAQAGMAELRELGLQLGFEAFTHPVLTVRGLSVASSQIRSLIAEGAVSKARALLGRPFSIVSTQARGRGIGTKLLVPTINLAPYSELLPAHGVYITRLRISDGPQAPCFDAVTNAGNRPTFGEESYAIEVLPARLRPNAGPRALRRYAARADLPGPSPRRAAVPLPGGAQSADHARRSPRAAVSSPCPIEIRADVD